MLSNLDFHVCLYFNLEDESDTNGLIQSRSDPVCRMEWHQAARVTDFYSSPFMGRAGKLGRETNTNASFCPI